MFAITKKKKKKDAGIKTPGYSPDVSDARSKDCCCIIKVLNCMFTGKSALSVYVNINIACIM